MTKETTKIQAVPDPADAWDEGTLGREEQFVECAPEDVKRQIHEAVGMQMISIRLQQQLIEGLKLIAKHRGIGYQPLIRDVLARFARSEILLMVKEMQEQEQARALLEAQQAETKRA